MAPNISALLVTRAVHWLRNVILFSSFLMMSWAWLSSSQRGTKDCTESNILKSIQPKYSAMDSNTYYVVSADSSKSQLSWWRIKSSSKDQLMNDTEILITLLASRPMQGLTKSFTSILDSFFLYFPNLPLLYVYLYFSSIIEWNIIYC